MFSSEVRVTVKPSPIHSLADLFAGIDQLNSVEKHNDGKHLASLSTCVGDLASDMMSADVSAEAVAAGVGEVVVRALALAAAKGASSQDVLAGIASAGADFATDALARRIEPIASDAGLSPLDVYRE